MCIEIAQGKSLPTLARDNTSLIVAYLGGFFYGLSNGFRLASQADVRNAIQFPLSGLSPQFYA